MTSVTGALGPDSAGTVITRTLEQARRSIDAAVYEVGPSYRWTLIRAAERGIRVRLVLDAHPSDGNAATARELIARGGGCRVAGEGAVAAHGKVLLIDDRTVAVGTGNLIWRDAPRDRHLRLPPAAPPLTGTREWWAFVSRSRRLCRVVAHDLAALWETGTAPPERWSALPEASAPVVGEPTPQVPPATARVGSRQLRFLSGGASIGAAALGLVRGARRQVLVTVPYAHARVGPVRLLFDAMESAAARGAECALLLGAVPADVDQSSLPRGLPIRRMDPTRSTTGHAKGMIADREVLVSSANWSAAGLGPSWEAALLISHAGMSAYFEAAWRRDWETAVPVKV